MRISRFSNAFLLAFRISAVLMIIFSLLLAGSVSVHPALATGSNTWTVNVLTDSSLTTCSANAGSAGPACELRDALSKTVNGDTITFSVTGTITLTATLTIGTNVTIQGPGASSLAIDGNHAVTVFTVNSGITTSINSLTIQNGNTTINGGGINNSGTLTISNSTLSGNSASGGGGGIFNINGIVTISNSTLSGNLAGDGGGVGNTTGIVTISNSILSGNGSGNDGGAVDNFSAGTLTISNSTLSGNSAIHGGGVNNFSTGIATISNSTLSGNVAGNGGNGGGVVNWGTLTISNSTLARNSAGDGGGGIDNGPGTLTISNSTLSGNSAGFGGGGLFNSGASTVEISNSTLSGNVATYYGGGGSGGGVENISPYNVSLLSSIIAGNTASTNGPDFNGSATSLGHNLIGDTTGAVGFIAGDQLNVNPLLGSLASNGGPTQTQAITVSSPAYGKGDCGGNASVNPPVPSVTADQRGFPRKTPCDVGAFETFSPKIDTIGIYRAGTFYMRLHNSTGNADLTVAFTAGTKPYPIVGDWTGSGFDTVGVFNQNNGQFSLRNSNTPGTPDEQFVLGNPNDQPLSGRWLISATNAGVGVFRPSNGLIYLKNALSTGFADYTMVLGIPGDVGLAGDWNGKGFDSPGVYRSSNSTFYLSNQVKNGSVIGDYQFAYGIGGDAPVTGDWIAQGHDGVGLFRQSNGFTYLKNQMVTGYADNSFTYGIAGDVPVAGHWQAVYPPIAPAPVLIAKTAVPSQSNGSADGNNPIGD